MIRAKATIIILVFCLVVLCTGCLLEWPLLTRTYHDRPVKHMFTLNKTLVGKKVVEHYSSRLNWMVSHKYGRYKDIDPENPQKAYFILAGYTFTGMMAVFVSIICLVLFILNFPGLKIPDISPRATLLALLLVVLNGTIIRLALGSICYGNNDMAAYEIVSRHAADGENVYAKTTRYNYTFIWSRVLGTARKIADRFPSVFFPFLIRSFLSVADIITLTFLLLIAKMQNLSFVKTSIFFYLNPISFLITGYHGQFENLAIMMLVIGIFLYFRVRHKPNAAKGLLWGLATLAMIIKHNIFYELIICVNRTIKRPWLKIFLLGASVIIFLSLFIPFWPEGKRNIINRVFMYSGGYTGRYGLRSFIDIGAYKYIFAAGLVLFPLFLKSKDLICQCLSGMLFCIAFTAGIGNQYFILPVALGALRPSKGFFFYTLTASVFLLGSGNNVFVPYLYRFQWNVVWVAATAWFLVHMYHDRHPESALPA